MGERTLGLKPAAETPADGNGQPANNTPDSTPDVDTLEKEIDTSLGKEDVEIKEGEFDDDEETVVLSKKQLEKLKEVKDNYKQGLLSVKDKLKVVKRPPVAAAPKPQVNVGDDAPLTRKDVITQNEKTAIKEICEDKYNDDNYDEIIKFYHAPSVPIPSVEDMKEAWEDAKYKFIRRNPDKAPKETGNVGDLATDRGVPIGQTTKDGKPAEKKRIIPQKTQVGEWYK